MRRHSVEPAGHLIYHSHSLRYQNFTRDIDPWMLPWINKLIHNIFVYLATGKFPLLVFVLWHPTYCNFTMHSLQNILDTFIIQRGPMAYLSNHRGVISHLRTLGYTHTLKPPSDCRFNTSYGRAVDSTKITLPVCITLITSWLLDMLYNNLTMIKLRTKRRLNGIS